MKKLSSSCKLSEMVALTPRRFPLSGRPTRLSPPLFLLNGDVIAFAYTTDGAHAANPHSAYDQKDSVRRRELFCWIKIGKERVAAVQLFEYEPSLAIDNEDFLLIMDTEDGHDGRLAEVLCNGWREFVAEVTAYGNLVDFRMAWAHPTNSPHGLWSEAAKRLIAAVFPDHALLTMKAFPLEYEGSIPRDAPSRTDTGLLFRQRAMIRYYEKQFGVNQFPGKSGQQDWLYKINPIFTDYIISPIDGAN